MRLFLGYLRAKRTTIFACAAFTLIFLASFALYQLPPEAVVYPALLSLVLGCGLLVLDYLRLRRLCRGLSQIGSSAAAVELPSPRNPVEEEYAALIRRLLDEQAQVQTEFSGRLSRMTDYYTLWAHQIKTPIAALRLQLQREDTDASRASLLELGRIEQYVQMVMAYLRLDSDTTDYVFRPCELDGVLRAAVKKYASEFIGRKISLVYEPVSTRIVTDEKWLQFVLEQLIGNALKYTPQGSIRLFMAAPDTLAIEDTGIGIAAEDLPRIFDRGFTGQNGRADKAASGLGLYLCARVCNNLGHGLHAESTPGAGTRILITFSQQNRCFE